MNSHFMHNLGKFKYSNPMQPKSIETNNIKKLSNTAILQPVDDVVTNFTMVIKMFSNCHHGYNTSKFMDEGEIKQLGKNTKHANKNGAKYQHLFTFTEQDINSFLAFYRASFPEATILPKMHILEDHVIPWFRRWHLGFGIMGEQGAHTS